MGRALTLFLVLLLTLAADAPAQSAAGGMAAADHVSSPRADWPQFRGPDRSGISLETGLLRAWPEEGPREVWRRPIGEGFSSIVVVGEHFYTLFAAGEDEYLGCFRTADAGELWRLRIGETFHDEFGNGPRSTPTVADGVVYGLGGKGRLVAAQAATGEVLWEAEMTESHPFLGPQGTPTGPKVGVVMVPLFGYATSPLLEGDLLIVEAGTGNGKTYVALDKTSGKTRWTALDEPGITYSSPKAVTIDGERQILVFTFSELVSLLPTGEVHWRHPWSLTIAQPAFLPPNRIFISTTNVAGGQGEGGAMVLQVHTAADGAATVETVWESRIIRNYSASSVAWEGHLYGFDNATLRCVEAATGEQRWAKRGLGKGTLVVADGLLIVFRDRGGLTLAEAGPEGYQQRGSVQVFAEGRTWTPPSVARGKLYLRGRTDVVCLDLKGSS